MINKNFNSISQFSVPQEWIDGALSVPQNRKRKKPVVFVKFSRTFAAVISLVIVCSISMLLFFLTEDNAVPPIKEPDSTTSVTDVENNGDATVTPDAVIKPTLAGSENLPNGESDTSPSQGSSSAKPTQPTVEPTEAPSEGSLLPIKPTEQPPTYAPDVPTEVPTDAPTEEPTSRPTVAPTDEPTPPPWEEPTDAPTEEPTESIDFYNIGIHRRVDTTQLTGSNKVYCKLYDPYGSLMGDSNLFASSHLAIKGITDPSVTVVHYYPYRNMDITISGSYAYVFYNESGEELAKGSIYLQSNVK